MDFEYSPQAQDYLNRVEAFIDKEIKPVEGAYFAWLREQDNPWQVAPVIRELKEKARQAGLWNLFLPDAELGAGLSVLEYAPLAEASGYSLLAPEIFNCNAPDTGNMEVLHLYGSDQQKQQWLTPLLAGEIRSAFCMTEPEVASSDATNMAATAVLDGDEVVVNGRKWWSTGIGHPDCRFVIFMGLSDPDGERHRRHSMVIVPTDTPGVNIERMLSVFGDQDPPYGHGEVSFDQVRVPKDNLIAGIGRGFEIAQGRLGPGRIHHCMRLIGAAEAALELMCKRALDRKAFGKPLAQLGGNMERIARARVKIDQARQLTLRAAWMIDHKGVRYARNEIAQIKVVAPSVAQEVIDDAIQIHGGAGLSEDFPLAMLFAQARALRLADGPDEVHLQQIARMELSRYE